MKIKKAVILFSACFFVEILPSVLVQAEDYFKEVQIVDLATGHIRVPTSPQMKSETTETTETTETSGLPMATNTETALKETNTMPSIETTTNTTLEEETENEK